MRVVLSCSTARRTSPGFTFINEMYNTHKIIPSAAWSATATTSWNNKAYQSGQVAFINNPTSVYAYLAGEDPELMKKTGLFGVPAGPAGAVNQIDTWSLGVFSAAPEPELAKGLAEHMMQPDRYNQVITNTNGRFVPVYPELFNDPWWTERPEFSEFINIASTGVPISYAGPPTAASGEILATNMSSRRRCSSRLVEGVDPAEAVGRSASEDRGDLRALG